MVVIGIDLGTSSSVVAVSERGKTKVVENAQGKRQTPSCVTFGKSERLVGDAAIHQIARNPENTIVGAKKLLGLSFEEAQQLVTQRKWPYRIIDSDGKPKFQVEHDGLKEYYPEEIIAILLSHLKKDTEKYLDKPVTGAVITVPNSFDAVQRRAVKDAATIAGLPVIALLNETVAAAIIFGPKEQATIKEQLGKQQAAKKQKKLRVLVLHIGGGTFDVSVLTIKNRIYSVKASVGSSLGGDDYHENLFLSEMNKASSIKNSSINVKNVCKLRIACKKAKEELSLADSANIRVEALLDGKDFSTTISRSDFDKLNERYRQCIEEKVKEALEVANIAPDKIDRIILVGAATRMPIISKILTEQCRLSETKFRKTINVDEAPAQGAALIAEVLSSSRQTVEEIAIREVTNYSIVCESSEILCKGCYLPARRFYESIKLPSDGPSLRIYKNTTQQTLGEYLIHNNLPDKGLPKEISFEVEITTDGLLEVRECNLGTGITLRQKMGIDPVKMQQLKKIAESSQKEDQGHKKVMKALYELEQEFYRVTSPIDRDPDLRKKFKKDFDAIRTWIDNPSCSTIDEVMVKKDQLETLRRQSIDMLQPHGDAKRQFTPGGKIPEEPPTNRRGTADKTKEEKNSSPNDQETEGDTSQPGIAEIKPSNPTAAERFGEVGPQMENKQQGALSQQNVTTDGSEKIANTDPSEQETEPKETTIEELKMKNEERDSTQQQEPTGQKTTEQKDEITPPTNHPTKDLKIAGLDGGNKTLKEMKEVSHDRDEEQKKVVLEETGVKKKEGESMQQPDLNDKATERADRITSPTNQPTKNLEEEAVTLGENKTPTERKEALLDRKEENAIHQVESKPGEPAKLQPEIEPQATSAMEETETAAATAVTSKKSLKDFMVPSQPRGRTRVIPAETTLPPITKVASHQRWGAPRKNEQRFLGEFVEEPDKTASLTEANSRTQRQPPNNNENNKTGNQPENEPQTTVQRVKKKLERMASGEDQKTDSHPPFKRLDSGSSRYMFNGLVADDTQGGAVSNLKQQFEKIALKKRESQERLLPHPNLKGEKSNDSNKKTQKTSVRDFTSTIQHKSTPTWFPPQQTSSFLPAKKTSNVPPDPHQQNPAKAKPQVVYENVVIMPGGVAQTPRPRPKPEALRDQTKK